MRAARAGRRPADGTGGRTPRRAAPCPNSSPGSPCWTGSTRPPAGPGRARRPLGSGRHRHRSAADTARAAELLTTAAVRQVDGLTGSEEPEDARALLELAQRADRVGRHPAHRRPRPAGRRRHPADRGAPPGRSGCCSGHEEAETLRGRASPPGWTGPWTAASRAALDRPADRPAHSGGPAAGPAAPAPSTRCCDRVVELADREFLDRLPALRGGFDTLSPAARDRLLATVRSAWANGVDTLDADLDPADAGRGPAADLAAREPSTALRPARAPARARDRLPPLPGHPAGRAPPPYPPTEATPARTIAPGRPAGGWCSAAVPTNSPRPAPPAGHRAGRAVRRGTRRGSPRRPRRPRPAAAAGSRRSPASGSGPRNWPRCSAPASARRCSPPRPPTRAAGRPHRTRPGRPPRPSVDLLRTVLRHAGGLPEARLAPLRPLVRRLVDELTRQLATRLRPALHRRRRCRGRPAARAAGSTCRAPCGPTWPPRAATADGTVRVIPERPVFRTRARRGGRLAADPGRRRVRVDGGVHGLVRAHRLGAGRGADADARTSWPSPPR